MGKKTQTGQETPADTFVWHDFAAIKDLVVILPKGKQGGVIELAGDNGQGKSTVIKSLEGLAGEELDSKAFDQTPRDGTTHGYLRVPGVVVNIFPRRTNFDPKGARVAARILNGSPLGRLINPNRKGAKERGEARNKALAELVDLQLTQAAIDGLSKGEKSLQILVPRGVNLLEAADIIRERALELAGDAHRDAEIAGKEAERHMESAVNFEVKIKDISGGEIPESILTSKAAKIEHEKAVRAAESKRISNQALNDLLDQRAELEPLRTPDRPDVKPVDVEIEDIDQRLPGLQQTHNEHQSRRTTLLQQADQVGADTRANELLVERLQAQLAAAIQAGAALAASWKLISDELDQEQHSDASQQARVYELTTLRSRKEELKRKRVETLAAADRWDKIEEICTKPIEGYATSEDVQSAELDIDTAVTELDVAQFHEQMQEALAANKSAVDRAREYTDLETFYRDIGWTVIPKVIADRLKELGLPGVELRAGVLYGEHPTRGMIPFDDLSPGQQVRLALQVALRGHDPSEGPAILPFPQEYWDALTPRVRAIIRYETHRAHVWMVTATARYNGELRVNETVPEEELDVLEWIEKNGELPEAENFMSAVEPMDAQASLF